MKIYLEGKQIEETCSVEIPQNKNARARLAIAKKGETAASVFMVWAYIGSDDVGDQAIFCYKKRLTKRAPDLGRASVVKDNQSVAPSG